MADLTQFVHTGLRPGDALGIYSNRFPRIGAGKMHEIAPLRLKVSGEGGVPKLVQASGSVTIIMPDLQPEGTCTLRITARGHLFGEPFDVDTTAECPYRTEGGDKPKLFIRHDDGELELHNRDRAWTWVGPGIPRLPWIGLWPETEEFVSDDQDAEIG